ncbi:hypothetical protein Acsp02_53690 [Actinoplanes sp. NBRC 103695]|nr:hypothetical protein Acsp02_53690 [Actinoplanes sp. NBRC 103695]
MVADQALELVHHLAAAAEFEDGPGALLEHAEPHLAEPSPFLFYVGSGYPCVRFAVPERDSTLEHRYGTETIALLEQATGVTSAMCQFFDID